MGLSLLVPLLAEGVPAPAGKSAQPSYAGTLLYVSLGSIWQMNLATLQRQQFLRVPNGSITHVSHSWDRQRLAYSMIVRGDGFRAVASRIVVTEVDGSAPRTVVQEEGSDIAVDWPAWRPDGAAIAYAKSSASDRTQRVEEVDLTTGARTLIALSGSSPAYLADGGSIVFTSLAGGTWSIWSIPRRGGMPSTLVSESGFNDVDHPLSAPDGGLLAFVGAGPGPERTAAGFASDPGPLGQPRAPVAKAHPFPGAQFDLWTVRPDGMGLQRFAELVSEEPFLAWSPDGQYVAAWGRLGLQVVDMTTHRPQDRVRWLTALPGGGPISWGS